MDRSTNTSKTRNKAAAKTDKSDTKADRPASKYVGVIYVHGMGSQRRYEETSRLIDAIDQYLGNSSRLRNDHKGDLRDIRPHEEPSRTDPKTYFTYIGTKLLKRVNGKVHDVREARFFEVYWAPVMAGQGSSWGVVKWVFSQVHRPWQTMRSPWRERQRLRRASLAKLREQKKKWPQGIGYADFDALDCCYDEFEGWAALRDWPAGIFADFLAFLETNKTKDADLAGRLATLAKAWFASYEREERRNAFLLVTLGLGLVLAAFCAVVSTLLLLQHVSGWEVLVKAQSPLLQAALPELNPTPSTAVGMVLSLAAVLGINGFLTAYLGDVQAWATYEETDEKHVRRNKVIAQGVDVITHVVNDDRCERAIVVSHSLGTSIAHDTLLSIARANRAYNARDPISGPVRLDKIEHFVTIASPIDKINYFFESYGSQYHRYKRVVEEVRGDIGTPPFARNRSKPYVHWVNFWDEGDIISGALRSPANSRELTFPVDNVCIANLAFPDPSASHSAYFGNRTVIGHVFEMIYNAAYSFERLPLVTGKGYDYASAYLGPGAKRGRARAYFALALAMPWLGLAALVLYCFGWLVPIRYTLLWLLVACAAALVAAFVYGWKRSQLEPL